MAKVTFDGPNKLIIVDYGVTELDVRADLYSDWKEWMLLSDNSKYLPAFRTVGGDPTKAGEAISPYYFLLNGWLIRPHEDDHELFIDGNLYGDEGADLITPTLGAYTVLVTIDRSVNAITIEVEGTGEWTEAEKEQIRDSLGVDGTKSTATGGQVQVISSDISTLSSDVATIDTRQQSMDARLILLEKLARNKLELADGDTDNWVLYDDDDVTPLLTFSVTDKDGNALYLPAQAPAKRTRGI